jgi:hypothetical protein
MEIREICEVLMNELNDNSAGLNSDELYVLEKVIDLIKITEYGTKSRNIELELGYLKKQEFEVPIDGFNQESERIYWIIRKIFSKGKLSVISPGGLKINISFEPE